MRSFTLSMAAAVTIVTLSGGQASALMLFGVNNAGGQLNSIDPADGAATPAPSPLGSLGTSILGLAFAPDGTLFGVNDGEAGPTLVTIDTGTGVASTSVGFTGPTFSIPFGLAFRSDGSLYSVDLFDDTLLTIDSTTAAVTTGSLISPDGTTALSDVTGIEFDISDVLYGIDNQNDALITIDIATGLTSNVANLSTLAAGVPALSGLAIAADNTFYSIDTDNDALVTINPTTGAITTVGAFSSSFTDIISLAATPSAAVAPIPLPAPAALLLISLGGLAFVRARRHA
ncbi:MAG: hypothetical protein AAF675_06625 [Pseudomonadota bacterium]